MERSKERKSMKMDDREEKKKNDRRENLNNRRGEKSKSFLKKVVERERQKER